MGSSINFYLEPKQISFLQAADDEVLYSGGFGGGKTLMVCLKAFVRAQHPRAVEVLCRAVEADVHDTILPTLFEGNGATPAILQPGCYIWNKARKWIRLLGPGQMPLGIIRYRGLGAHNQHNLEKMGFRGQNVTGVGIDQVEEISSKQYNNVLGRVRVTDEGLTRQVYGSANPSAPSHFLAQRFGIRSSHSPEVTPEIVTTLEANGRKNTLRAILTCPAENPHLPADYLARLASYTGVERLRYVLGRWVASEGIVYDNFLRDTHVKDRPGPWARAIVAIDDGTSKPAAMLLVLIDHDGKRHYAEECHRAGMSDHEKVMRVEAWSHKYGPLDAVVVDPAAAALKLSLSRVGLPVFDGRNEVRPGISVVRSGLDPGVDGEPGWTIAERCVKTIGELEGYMWDPNSKDEKPIKRDDHGPDAIRYAEQHLYAPPALVFAIDPDMEAVAKHAQAAWRGTLVHEHPIGREMDMSLAAGRWRDITLERDAKGPLRLWRKPVRDLTAKINIFVSVGHGQNQSHLVMADMRTKQITGEFVAPITPERLSRVAAMLALYFGDEDGQASVGVMANTPGKVFAQSLGQIGYGADLWEPDPKEFAEAVGMLRAAWETRAFAEPTAQAIATARQYVYSGSTIMHASLVGDMERRGQYADGIIARAGLWRAIAGQEYSHDPGLEHLPSTLGDLRERAKAGLIRTGTRR